MPVAHVKRAENLALIKASLSRDLSAIKYILGGGRGVHVGKRGVHVTVPLVMGKLARPTLCCSEHARVSRTENSYVLIKALLFKYIIRRLPYAFALTNHPITVLPLET